MLDAIMIASVSKQSPPLSGMRFPALPACDLLSTGNDRLETSDFTDRTYSPLTTAVALSNLSLYLFSASAVSLA